MQILKLMLCSPLKRGCITLLELWELKKSCENWHCSVANLDGVMLPKKILKKSKVVYVLREDNVKSTSKQ